MVDLVWFLKYDAKIEGKNGRLQKIWCFFLGMEFFLALFAKRTQPFAC